MGDDRDAWLDVAPPVLEPQDAEAQLEWTSQAFLRGRFALAVDARDRIWTNRRGRYELELWEPRGERPLGVLHRAGTWLEPTDVDEYLSLSIGSRPPRPLALTIDPQGRLWVFASGSSPGADSLGSHADRRDRSDGRVDRSDRRAG